MSFKTERLSIPISEKHGQISAEVCEPDNVEAVIVLGHGAGSNMDQPFLRQISSELASHNIASVRYNFVYSENRKKMPDRFPLASAVVKAVKRFASERYQGKPLFCSGKSFGGRMSSMTLAEDNDPGVKGIVFFGFPLHPAGSPSVERAEHLKKISIPMLFLQGTKDDLAQLHLLRPIIQSLPSATLVEFEGADHSFKGGKQTSVANLASVTADWIKTYA